MSRETGIYVPSTAGGITVDAFMPHDLPPEPPFALTRDLAAAAEAATHKCQLLNLAAKMVPDINWFLYGFVMKESVLSSEIEGTQATLTDVVTAEAGSKDEMTEDVEEVVNYVKALNYVLQELRKPAGLPVSARLLKEAHKRLMRGARGANKAPGEIRRVQNWIGGTKVSSASFIPPPPDKVGPCLDALERFIHTDRTLPPIIKAGLAHVQFETIHPFLDGNGRIGRLLITALLIEWNILQAPLLYLSLYFKRHQKYYYERLSAVRSSGAWEEWISFYLEGVAQVADEAVATAQRLFAIVKEAREKVLSDTRASVVAVKLIELLPGRPVLAMPDVASALKVTKPTAQKALDVLVTLKILSEISGKARGKRFAFAHYLKVLSSEQ